MIWGILDLSYTEVTELPKGLNVGHLYLDGAKISSLPEGIIVAENISLSGSALTRLPDGMTAYGDLDLSSTRIDRLPRGLTVLGDLHITGTAIAVLPDDLVVEGTLHFGKNMNLDIPERAKIRKIAQSRL